MNTKNEIAEKLANLKKQMEELQNQMNSDEICDTTCGCGEYYGDHDSEDHPDDYTEEEEEEDNTDTANEPAVVQASPRGELLHLQYGRKYYYQKHDVPMSQETMYKFLEANPPNSTSFYGSSTPYVTGTQDWCTAKFKGDFVFQTPWSAPEPEGTPKPAIPDAWKK